MFIGQFIEFTIAMGRIQNFLLCDEINPSIVQIDPNRNEAVSIEGNYFWGIDVGTKKTKATGKAKSREQILDKFKQSQ